MFRGMQNLFQKDVAKGKCPYTKYYRKKAKTKKFARHKYAKGLHYHYRCVLEKVPKNVRNEIVKAEDTIALKTHYPDYKGLEGLMKSKV